MRKDAATREYDRIAKLIRDHPIRRDRTHNKDRGQLGFEARQLLKYEVFKHYSGKILPTCSKCGFDDLRALDIHHDNNNGWNDRLQAANGRGGNPFYNELKKKNFPSGYSVLCNTCNNLHSGRGGDSTLKREVFRHYNPEMKCSQCSENRIRALTLDHVKNNGAEHRRLLMKEAEFASLGNTREICGLHFYEYLRKYDFPVECERGGLYELQVLCWNCQRIK